MDNLFKQAIDDMLLVQLTFNANDKGIITRTCVPFDFGPSRRYKDGENRYHFYDLDSPDGNHNLSILPEQVVEFELTNENFEPGDYIKWTPNWFYKRDWGKYS
jgi:hypothetical protein